jgi:hypothetical protein
MPDPPLLQPICLQFDPNTSVEAGEHYIRPVDHYKEVGLVVVGHSHLVAARIVLEPDEGFHIVLGPGGAAHAVLGPGEVVRIVLDPGEAAHTVLGPGEVAHIVLVLGEAARTVLGPGEGVRTVLALGEAVHTLAEGEHHNPPEVRRHSHLDHPGVRAVLPSSHP